MAATTKCFRAWSGCHTRHQVRLPRSTFASCEQRYLGAVGHVHWARSIKTKNTIDVNQLPQGVLKTYEVDENNVEVASYPTVVQQARNHMRKFANCVLITRVGGFYELYFEHAEQYGPLLNLKVGCKKTTAGPVAMAGFPFFQLDRFLKILVDDHNMSVAISEEFTIDAAVRAQSGGLLFDRRVARIVTPGTLVDEKFMDPQRNNFLLALHSLEEFQGPRNQSKDSSMVEITEKSGRCDEIGLAWVDLSTGEFYTQSTVIEDLLSSLVRIGPREIIMNQGMKDCIKQDISRIVKSNDVLTTWLDDSVAVDNCSWPSMFQSALDIRDCKDSTRSEIAAGSMLLNYVQDRLLGSGLNLQGPVRYLAADSMGIDKNTMKGLELLETSKDGVTGGKGSLLHTIQKTVTKSGARLLRQRISSPSTSVNIINERLDCVEQLTANPLLKEGLVGQLRRTIDSQRIVQRFSLCRGDADDLLDLQKTIVCTRNIVELLSSATSSITPPSHRALYRLSERIVLDEVTVLARRIAGAIDEDSLSARHRGEESGIVAAPISVGDECSDYVPNRDHIVVKPQDHVFGGLKSTDSSTAEVSPWIMRRSASQVLNGLHEDLDKLLHEKVQLGNALKNKIGASSLTLRWTPALGHICHVRGPRDVKVTQKNLPLIRTVSSSKSTMSFYVQEWSNLGTKLDQLKVQITSEEQAVFQALRDEVVRNLAVLRTNAKVLDELDVACSFATLAAEHKLVRPVVNDGIRSHIVAGRHATVNVGLEERGRSFIPNDCLIGEAEQVWLITGPNMAGKSTFLRQNALITILAQVGAYVPAAHAEIGIVDRIFSRIGAADNLYLDQSTFMVEMLETASILKAATPRSFVIMDEVGRGTTPEDGIAISYACLHHLYHINRCRTLFATHFHVLADMTHDWTRLGTYCNDVRENKDGSFSFMHLLQPGVNRRSYALKVAQLAGVPLTVIATARTVLETRQ